MRKYYTIEKTTWTSRPALEKMIRTLVGNRKPVDKYDGLGVPKRKNFLGGQNFKKKIGSDGVIT